jgi:hypothetical protein
MKETHLRVRRRQDGTLDPGSFSGLGIREVVAWLRSRMTGMDSVIPVDRRADEDPEALIVGLLRDIGAADPVSRLIASSVRQLLVEASSDPALAAPFIVPLLRLCQQVVLPIAADWFVAELASIAFDLDRYRLRWQDPKVVDDIIRAATVQAPGLPSSSSRAHWLALLQRPEMATAALLGLAPSFRERAMHLSEWWSRAPSTEKLKELRFLLVIGQRTEGIEGVKQILMAVGSSWPGDLKVAVNKILVRNETRAAFVTATEQVQTNAAFVTASEQVTTNGTHWCALQGAARKRSIVLNERGGA